MSRSMTDIMGLLAGRRATRGVLMETAREISAYYNNEVAIPLPGLTKDEKPAVANFIAQGIDQHAMRIAQTMPDIQSYPLTTTDAAFQRAKSRRQAAFGWFQQNTMTLAYRKRARHFVAYAGSAVYLRPGMFRGIPGPRWEVKSPLDTYPAPTLDAMDMLPDDCMFVFNRSWGWLKATYPNQAAAVSLLVSKQAQPKADSLVECVQYVDGEELVLLASGSGELKRGIVEAEFGIGDAKIVNLTSTVGSKTWATELERHPNLAGTPLVVFPGRISLDDSKGQFDDTRGIFQMMSTMAALDVHANARQVFAEQWMVADPGGSGAQIITQADGIKGIIGEIEGGHLDTITMQTPPQTMQTINFLERALRQTGAIPADYGGESPTNVRTDRRGASVSSAAVDWHIAEAQDVFSASFEAEFDIAAKIELGYYRNDRKSFYVQGGKSPGQLTYTPGDIWAESTQMVVRYAFSGMDANAQEVAIGQKVGLHLLSRETAMMADPAIYDVELERNRITGNLLDDAMLTSIQTMASQGAIPPGDVARIKELLRDPTMTLEKAVQTAQSEAQARQASSGPPGTPTGPVPPGSPEAQPGLAAPGAGAEQPTGVPAAPGGLDNLRGLLGDLKSGSVLTGPKFNG